MPLPRLKSRKHSAVFAAVLCGAMLATSCWFSADWLEGVASSLEHLLEARRPPSSLLQRLLQPCVQWLWPPPPPSPVPAMATMPIIGRHVAAFTKIWCLLQELRQPHRVSLWERLDYLVTGGLAAAALVAVLCRTLRGRHPCKSRPPKSANTTVSNDLGYQGDNWSVEEHSHQNAHWRGTHHSDASRDSQDEDNSTPAAPLSLPRLRSPDRRDILGQRWLSDDVMDLAQELLQREFPGTRGLYACGAAFTLPPLEPGRAGLFLQVVNRSAPNSLASMADYNRPTGSHWLLLSSYGAARPGQLAVYDSLYDSLSSSTAELVQQLQELYVPPPGVVLRPVQRQRDGHSCGLFALAFAFSIANGQDPCSVRYVRASMAQHLLWCLEHTMVQPFPSVPAGTRG